MSDAEQIEACFADGSLRIEVDSHVTTTRDHRLASFVDYNTAGADTEVRWVHVISTHRGGEIRGYAMVKGELRERGPHYMEWPELDAAVSQRIGMPIYRRHQEVSNVA